MKIGDAIEECRKGRAVRRPTWRAGERVYYVPATGRTRAFLTLRCHDGLHMPWTPLSWDLLADDWEIC